MRVQAVFHFYLPYLLPKAPGRDQVRLRVEHPQSLVFVRPRGAAEPLFPDSPADRSLSAKKYEFPRLLPPAPRLRCPCARHAAIALLCSFWAGSQRPWRRSTSAYGRPTCVPPCTRVMGSYITAGPLWSTRSCADWRSTTTPTKPATRSLHRTLKPGIRHPFWARRPPVEGRGALARGQSRSGFGGRAVAHVGRMIVVTWEAVNLMTYGCHLGEVSVAGLSVRRVRPVPSGCIM
jgi:hypothetical protein